jgi:membrane associated rhomboid family serine protease
MKVRYNAPVSITFALVALIILAIDQLTQHTIISSLFTAPSRGTFQPLNVFSYLRLLLHIFGHANWTHYMSNFAFILLLGPGLEEKYGSGSMVLMIAITALVTGLLNAFFLPAGLMGASGIVFMMILLTSFTNIRQGELPITFILVVLIFLAKEVINGFRQNSVSEFAHIVGGVLGSLFGFFKPVKQNK